ncbi:MAG: recombination regulator RecX [Gammaproteobacteria bacterium]|nr:recombination regulator RecX [Gammaproteobacteria bacterium]MCW8840276.1 recombination regulator RecX [Gammaproteobacteria bacterium]MCW8958407.1 recombination regulator RecX [Gammaproteobacteria bacterium]MCW8973095.1 recombination regulator RecX [Gammaproteobacteria bacterium]MCW8993220.1 recombination regulator RecX [Gammaproteobacteria bacterium]
MSDSDNALNHAEAYALAVGLLARREHSARELASKLTGRGVASEVSAEVLERLAADRLQSDERFAEAYLRQRSQKGYGPQRIAAELRERGIDDLLVAAALRQAEEEGEVDWFALAAAAYRKKFGSDRPADIRERAKRQRFMLYRGFSHEQIAEMMGKQ